MLDMKDKRKYALSPTFITILYLYVTFFLGELLFYNEIYRLFRLQNEYYESWKTLPQNVTFYNLCSLILVISYLQAKPNRKLSYLKVKSYVKPGRKESRFSWKYIILGLVLLAVVVKIPVSALAFAVPFFSVGLVYVASKNNTNLRYVAYVLIIVTMMALNPNDKRETIFLFYPILFLELLRIKKITFKQVIIVLSGGVLVFLAVVIMSLIRADVSSTIFIPKDVIVQYITSDAALAIIADNFEINWCYIDAFQSMEFINSDSSLISWGSSFLKPLFWPISRDIWPNKPESTMLLFTTIFDKTAKEEGMSLPLPLVSDMYWNFKYFSVVFVYLIQYWLNSMYKSTVRFFKRNKDKNLLSTREFVGVYFLFIFLFLMRGCGIDMFLAYLIVFHVLLFLLNSILSVRGTIIKRASR